MSHVVIVTPCFNDGATLRDSLDSALAQTHDDLHVIIVDDGSTDGATIKLLDELEANSDPRVTVLRQANGGSAAARNTAIAEARLAAYILPLDADDIIGPNYVAEAVAVLDADDRVGVVMSRAESFGLARGPLDLPDFTVSRLLVDNAIWVCSMFRRADWEAVGGYDERLDFEEDHDFWLGIVGLGRSVVRLDERHYRYRQRPGQKTRVMLPAERAGVRSAMFRKHAALYVRHADDVAALWRERRGLLRRFARRYGWIDPALRRERTRTNGWGLEGQAADVAMTAASVRALAHGPAERVDAVWREQLIADALLRDRKRRYGAVERAAESVARAVRSARGVIGSRP